MKDENQSNTLNREAFRPGIHNMNIGHLKHYFDLKDTDEFNTHKRPYKSKVNIELIKL